MLLFDWYYRWKTTNSPWFVLQFAKKEKKNSQNLIATQFFSKSPLTCTEWCTLNYYQLVTSLVSLILEPPLPITLPTWPRCTSIWISLPLRSDGCRLNQKVRANMLISRNQTSKRFTLNVRWKGGGEATTKSPFLTSCNYYSSFFLITTVKTIPNCSLSVNKVTVFHRVFPPLRKPRSSHIPTEIRGSPGWSDPRRIKPNSKHSLSYSSFIPTGIIVYHQSSVELVELRPLLRGLVTCFCV